MTSRASIDENLAVGVTSMILSFSSGNIEVASPEVEETLGYLPNELIGLSFAALIHPEDQFAFDDAETLFWESRKRSYLRVRLLDARSEYVEVDIAFARRTEGDDPTLTIELSLLEATIDLDDPTFTTSEIDEITGLYTIDYLNSEYERVRKVIGDELPGVALLLVDIDRFSVIESALGVHGSHAVLRVVANRFEDALGGLFLLVHVKRDNFAVLCLGVTEHAQVEMVAHALRTTLDSPVIAPDGEEVVVTASIGVAFAFDQSTSGVDLVDSATLARDRAKARGSGKLEYFAESMVSNAKDRRNFENMVRRAIDDEDIVVLFQPIISLEARKICGVEALVRLRHQDRGLISPTEFIPVAKEIGRLPRMGAKVAKYALESLQEWQRRYPDQELTLGLNLSGDELEEPDLVSNLISQVGASGIDPSILMVEIGTVDNNPSSKAHNSIEQLAKANIGLSVDEFGAGSSALSIFSRYQVSQVKIDRSLVLTLGQNERVLGVVGGLVNLAHSMKAEVVGIGVERAEQIRLMRSINIDKVQGYHIGPPIERDQIETQLELLSVRPTS
ncbi:MAG: GGDEF domain-containing protein [Actinomycetota bacterium]|nr:GGDEF domain-containing protein [Actinomycetota bacterium]